MEDWLNNIAPKYMDVEDVNTLKTSLFGYINEVMSKTVRNSHYHKNMIMNEVSLNTASLPHTIYNEAILQNYEIKGGNPARMTVSVSIGKDDIINNSVHIAEDEKLSSSITNEYNDDVIIFRIDNSNYFNVDEYKYMLEYDILIIGTKGDDGSYALSARYDIDGEKEIINELTDPYLKMWIENDMIFIIANIFNMTKHEKVFDIYSDDVTENIFYDINIDSQLVDFFPHYIHNDEDNIINKYFNSTFIPDDDEYCYYTFTDDENLQVFFSTLPTAFKPKFNSSLNVEYYTTKGSECNFSFSGDIYYSFEDSKLETVQVLVIPISDSTDGKDKMTLMEIKQDLIKNYLTRNSIITENDLNNYFNTLTNLTNINRGEIQFIKKRDDIIKRIVSSYIFMKDSNNNIIPSNTFDLFIDNLDLTQDRVQIPTGSLMLYDDVEGSYRLKLDIETEADLRANYEYVYVTPFLLEIRINPFPMVTSINDSIDKTFNLENSYINPSINAEFIINDFNIKRDSLVDDEYTIKFSLNTNLPIDDVIGTEANSYNDKKVKMRAVLKDNDNELGYFDFTLDSPTELTYTATLTTNNVYDENGDLTITNSVYDFSNVSIPELSISEDVTIELGILYNDGVNTFKFNSFNSMSDIGDYTTTVVKNTIDHIEFYSDLSSVQNLVLASSDNTAIDMINGVMGIGDHYFYSYDNYKDIYTQLDHYIDILKMNIDRLEQNTMIDLKASNTFGISTQYDSNSVNISLELDIKLFVDYSNSIDTKIKKFIIDFVYNTNRDSTKFFAISNLVQELENSFDEIQYIIFKSLNGGSDQKVLYTYPTNDNLSKEQLINYVPEYLNVTLNSDDYNPDRENIDSGITLNYIY